MKAIALALAILFVAAPAQADRWKSKRIAIVDSTGWTEVREAAERWDAATVVKLPVASTGTGISVVIANLGPHRWFAETTVQYAGGHITGATITINSYLNPDTFPANWKRFWIENQLGIALAGLPLVCRIGSVMSGCQDGTGAPGLPQYPDAGDVDAMNAAYGR